MGDFQVRGIAIGDVHLCSKSPVCRVDNWYETQFNKLKQVADLCIQRNCSLVIAGDLYDRHNCPHRLVADTNNCLYGVPQVRWVAGNHDLPYHSVQNYFDSPLAVTQGFGLSLPLVEEREVIFQSDYISGASWGQEVPAPRKDLPFNILVQHKMVWHKEPLPFQAPNSNVAELYNSDTYKDYNLVITGDNHKTFVYRKDTRHIWINTGPIMRTSVAEREYQPSCWYYEVTEDSVNIERIPLKVDLAAVDRTEMYIDKLQDSIVSEFVTDISNRVTTKANFEYVVNELSASSTKEVQEVVSKVLSEVKQTGKE